MTIIDTAGQDEFKPLMGNLKPFSKNSKILTSKIRGFVNQIVIYFVMI